MTDGDEQAAGSEDGHAADGLLEGALERLDERLAETSKALAAAQREVKRAVEAARVGNLRDLPRALDSAAEASAALTESVRTAERSWGFDGEQHLDQGWTAELLDRAEAGGLSGVKEVDGQVYSFPVIVKVNARDLSLKVGGRTQRGLRPSVVVGMLERLRAKPAKDNPNRLATAFEKAYLTLTGGTDGTAIQLRRIYDLLVLRPGQSRDYSELDFIMDVYRLDRSGLHVTSTGRELSFPASTGTRGGKNVFRFVTESGRERLYSSIRFDSE